MYINIMNIYKEKTNKNKTKTTDKKDKKKNDFIKMEKKKQL